MDHSCGGLEVHCRDKAWQEIEAQCKILDESHLWISDLSLSSPRGQGESNVAYELAVQPASAGREAAKFRVVMGGPQDELSKLAGSSKLLVSCSSMSATPANSHPPPSELPSTHASDVFPISGPHANAYTHSHMHGSGQWKPMRLALGETNLDSLAQTATQNGLRSPLLSAASSRSFNSGRGGDMDSGSAQVSGEVPHSGMWEGSNGWSGSNGGGDEAYPPLEVEFVDGALGDDGYPPLEVEFVEGSLDPAEEYEGEEERQGWRSNASQDWGEGLASPAPCAPLPSAGSAYKLSPRLSLASLPSEADACLRMTDYAPFQPITPQPTRHTQSDRWHLQSPSARHHPWQGFRPTPISCPGISREERGEVGFSKSMRLPSGSQHNLSPRSAFGSLEARNMDNSGKLPQVLASMSRSLDVQAHARSDLPSPTFPSPNSDSGKHPLPSPGSEPSSARIQCFRSAFREAGSKASVSAWSAVVPSLSTKLQRQPSVGPTILEEEAEGSNDTASSLHSSIVANPLPTGVSSARGAALPRMTLFQAMSARAPQGSKVNSAPLSSNADGSASIAGDRSILPEFSKERGLKKSTSANERQGLGEEEGDKEGPQFVRRMSSGTRSQAIALAPTELGFQEQITPKMPRRPVYLGTMGPTSSFQKIQGEKSMRSQLSAAKAESVAGSSKYLTGVVYTANNGSYKPACSWVVLPFCAGDQRP